MICRDQPLVEIIAWLQARLGAGADTIELEALDPDLGRGHYAGEVIEHGGERWVHRPFRLWVDLAERLGLRLLTPRGLDGGRIALRLQRLDPAARWDAAPAAAVTEKYGPASGFARIAKAEDPGFVIDLADALDRVDLGARPRILDLGVNDGDELELLCALQPRLRADAELVGVDHSAAALAVARARFPGATLHQADLNALAALPLGRFDLVLSIGTLHSPGVDDRAVLRQLVQDHLTPTGALILGFPNCRYLDGEVVFGARMKNFRQPELGTVVKDIAFYRKYLQQHHREVFVTGKHYLLVTGVRRPMALAPTDK